ncbi:MAG: glycosyltransferase family 1 protein [Solirubrobacteraceae bacterium]
MRRPGGTTAQPEAAGELLVLDCAYTLHEIRTRGLEHVVGQLDLDGFFAHVWQVHPLMDASAAEPGRTLFGPARVTRLSPRHTMIEAPIARRRSLRRVMALNLLLGQWLLFVRLCRLARGRGVSVIAVADPFYLGLWGLALSTVLRIPFVVKVNANYDLVHEADGSLAYPRLIPWRRLELLILRVVFSRADLVTVGSDDNLRYAMRHGASRRRIAFVPTGDMIAGVHRQPPHERTSIAEDVDLVDRRFIVYVARLEACKHPEDVLVALAEVRRAMPETALLMVGDGSMRAQLEAQAAELGVLADVRFAGVRDQLWIARALTSAAAVVCPLSGLALVEAALSSTPVVGYDVEWHSEFITSGVTGVLVSYRDTGALAQAITALLDDPERSRALGETARTRALQQMDRDEAVAIKRSVYARVSASPGRARRRRSGRRTRR